MSSNQTPASTSASTSTSTSNWLQPYSKFLGKKLTNPIPTTPDSDPDSDSESGSRYFVEEDHSYYWSFTFDSTLGFAPHLDFEITYWKVQDQTTPWLKKGYFKTRFNHHADHFTEAGLTIAALSKDEFQGLINSFDVETGEPECLSFTVYGQFFSPLY